MGGLSWSPPSFLDYTGAGQQQASMSAAGRDIHGAEDGADITSASLALRFFTDHRDMDSKLKR